NKAVGLQKISEYYDVPRERIIAFGDEDNELEMLEFAGCGVAMGNGIDEFKQIANRRTATNEEDGVARFLREYFSL
ncbi:UNVERIFIED_CONTAM: Cof-type HAD-IIB family hydrolase, partial [Bacillus subtilis]